MKHSGFWHTAMPALLGGCVYVGASAGGIVAGRSIKTAFWKGWDDPMLGGEEYRDLEKNKDNLFGADLCRGDSFFMHYEPSKHDELLELKQKTKSEDIFGSLKLVAEDGALFY